MLLLEQRTYWFRRTHPYSPMYERGSQRKLTLPNGDVEDEFTRVMRGSFMNSSLLSLQFAVQLGPFVHERNFSVPLRTLGEKLSQRLKWF